MSKKRMSDEEEKRWRKIVFMDDAHTDKTVRKTRPYVYGEEPMKQSWWERLTARFSRR